MAMFDEMSKTVKKFFEHLNTMLENDKDISINSTDELLRKYDKYTSEMIMVQYIDKAEVIAEIEKKQKEEVFYNKDGSFASWADEIQYSTLESIKIFINTLEVKDPYEQCVQYDSIKAGIQAHAETYSFNIESELFNQLTKEQQKLWRKEIEQAVISGGDAGVTLAKDTRYKENLEVKEVEEPNAPSEYGKYVDECLYDASKHFFSEGEDKYSVADLFYAGVRCGKKWHEKQGEQNPYSGVTFKYNGHTWGMCARDNGVEIIFDGELKAFLSSEKSFIYPIHPQKSLAPKSAMEAIKKEKVDNQNCVKSNKIEPKFKVGDWITAPTLPTAQVVNIIDDKYELEYIDGVKKLSGINYVDYIYFHWTIQDARDGDVLSNGKMIVIFKHFEEPSYRQHIVAYIGLDTSGDIQVTDDTWNLGIDRTKPATKEERDLLFQKMKEAGYEWDTEKKELKNIEDKSENYKQQVMSEMTELVKDYIRQKPVEPKFKVGNWYQCTKDFFGKGVTFDKNTAYYCAKEGCLQCEYGCHIAIVKELYDNFKLWTIEDVKNGDILAAHECVVLFKEIDGLNIKCHCTYHFMNNPSFYVNTLQNKSAFHPATKEQRDLLYRGMKEAGYQWNTEELKLEPIKQKCDVPANDSERNFIQSDDRDNELSLSLQIQAYLNTASDELYASGKPLYSEKRIKDIHKCMLMWKKLHDSYFHCICTWSEEDKDAIDMAIIALEDMYDEDAPNTTYGGYNLPFNKAAERLKSLKDRYTWKPSKEQIIELRRVISGCSYDIDPLVEIEKHLKKLMEE